MKKYILVILVFLIFTVANTFAQTATLKGKVVDDAQKAVELASVRIKEMKLVYVTGKDGSFEIRNLPAGNYTLIVSRIGYAAYSKKIKVKTGLNNILITLTVSPIQLGQAVVTGVRMPAIEKNVAFPVEAVSKNELESTEPNSIADALSEKPGIDIARDGAWGTMVNVRGLSGQNLVYLVDGARIETSTNIAGGLSLFDLNDIKKIEVIKGGLSTLYGTGATGGVVNIVTKQPEFERSLYLRGSAEYGYKNVNNGYSAGLNLFAGNQNWKAKISAGKRKAGDTRIPNGYLTNSGFEDYSYSFSGGVLPLKNLEVDAEFQYFKATNVGIPGGAAFPPNAKATYPEALRKMFLLNTVWRNPFNFAKTISLKYYNQFIRRVVEIIPAQGKRVSPSSDHETNGITLQSELVFGKHYLITGFDFWQRTYEGIRETRNDIADVTIVDKPIPNSGFASAGLFFNDEIYLTNKLKLNAGARYDYIRIKNEETNNPLYKIVKGKKIYPSPIKDASFKAQTNYNESWSGNLNLLYSVAKNIDLTFSLAKTFRSPSLEERFQYINLGGIIYLGNPDLQPERSLSFNGGFRFYGKRFSAKVNGFANFFNNLVIYDAVVKDSLYKKSNVGKARYYGFDAEVGARLCVTVWNLGISYVNAYDTENNKPLPQIPPLNGFVKFTAPLVNWGKLDLKGTFYADQKNVAEGEEKTPGYAVYDVKFRSTKIQLGTVKISLFAGVENFFNRSYRNHLSTYRGITLTEPGRNVFVKIKLEW